MSVTIVAFDHPDRPNIIRECETKGYKQAIVATCNGFCSMYHDPKATKKNYPATWQTNKPIYGDVVILMDQYIGNSDITLGPAVEKSLLGDLLCNED